MGEHTEDADRSVISVLAHLSSLVTEGKEAAAAELAATIMGRLRELGNAASVMAIRTHAHAFRFPRSVSSALHDDPHMGGVG